jgi:hypothetical protein
MSVRPVAVHEDGSVDVVYDEGGHSGTIAAAEVRWTTAPDGTEDHNFIVLNCPDGCGASSTHPVGGGADRVNVQQMFVNKIELDGCACGHVDIRSDGVPFSHARLLCNRMDGAGRWQIDTPVSMTAQAAATVDTFRITYRTSDRMVLGMEPEATVASDCGVQDMPLEQYEVLMHTDPAWLNTRGDRIIGNPPAAQDQQT